MNKIRTFRAGWRIIGGCMLAGFSPMAGPGPQVIQGIPGVAVQTATVIFSEVADIAAPVRSPQIPSPAPATNFLALADNNTSTPPDTQGAVGPNHLMTTLNTQIRIQSKAGGTLSTSTLSTFFGALASGGAYDPRLTYDPYNNRWILSSAVNAQSSSAGVVVGVSQTSDPTGTWFLYKFPAAGTSIVPDVPTLGFNKDWIVVASDIFDANAAYAYLGVYVYVVNKTNLYAHGSGLYTLLQTTNSFAPCPAVTYDNSLASEYLAEDFDASNGTVRTSLRLSAITGAIGSETLTLGVGFSTNTAWAFLPANRNFLPQLGSSQKIAVSDSQIQNCVYRNGYLWATHTIMLPSTSPTRASVQWWQLATNGTVRQVGRIDDSTGVLFSAYPSIGVNKNDDVLIGYSRFSTNQYASANYSFRFGYDALNTMRDSTVYKAGEGFYYKTFGGSLNRWGDYSSTVVDPTDDQTLWTLQEYAATPLLTGDGSGRWRTWWAKVIVPSLVAPTIFNPRLNGGNFNFSFQSVTDQNYTVEYKNSLSISNWTTGNPFRETARSNRSPTFSRRRASTA